LAKQSPGVASAEAGGAAVGCQAVGTRQRSGFGELAVWKVDAGLLAQPLFCVTDLGESFLGDEAVQFVAKLGRNTAVPTTKARSLSHCRIAVEARSLSKLHFHDGHGRAPKPRTVADASRSRLSVNIERQSG
jgi:hypothetical protein